TQLHNNPPEQRRTVSTSLWLQMSVVFCYLPYLLLAALAYRQFVKTKSPSFYIQFYSTVTLMCSNSILNPILYCWKIKETQVHNNPPEQENQTISLNILRYRRTVSTSLWLQMSVAFCYLPYLLLSPFAYRQIVKAQSLSLYTQFYSTVTLMCSNSILNPILYCWKIKEVRRVVKEILRCRQI
ncbi:hypothetical protein P5673_001158, partial [Acropora cervicornis]